MFRTSTYQNYPMMYQGYAHAGAAAGWSPWMWIQPFLVFLIPLIVIELILKGYSLWKAGRAGQLGWFIALLILNTLGILPIIYLVFFQKSGTMFNHPAVVKVVTTERPATKSRAKKK